MIKIKKNAGHIRRIFPAIVFITLSVLNLNAGLNQNNGKIYTIPDFAFPKTVEHSSDSLLNVSLQKGDDLMALRSVMNLIIARNELTDSESVQSNINLIDSIIPQLKSPYSDLAFLLEADILNATYNSRKYQFDNRALPLNQEFPKDPLQWSAEMYKISILSLINKATDGIDKPVDINITNFSLILNNCENAKRAGISINDFIALKGAEILAGLSSDYNATIIPFYPEIKDKSEEGKCKDKAMRLLNTIIERPGRDNSVVKAIASLRLLQIIPDYDSEKFIKNTQLKLKDTEGEGMILYALRQKYGRDNFEYYEEIRNWLKKYPKGFGAYELEHALSDITKETIEVDLPRLSLSHTPISGKITMRNLNRGYILVYKLSSGEYDTYDGLILKKFNVNATPVEVVEITEKGEIPFSADNTIKLKGLDPGVYAVVTSKNKKLPKDYKELSANAGYSTIRVTDIAILTSFNSKEKESGKVYVVDASNQKPIPGATVSYSTGDKKTTKGKLLTNQQGWVKIPENGYFRIEAKYKDNIARSEAGFGFYRESENLLYQTSILTDLEVYRPGDTINYAVVGWKQEKLANRLMKNTKIEVILLDANYSRVGCDTLTLNDQGRATGKFTVPKGRLLGRYQLTSDFTDFKNTNRGSVAVFIEEYKLPSFNVTMSQLKSEIEDELKFEGTAQTYSGMPVTDSRVEIKINYLPWRWWIPSQTAGYSFEAMTNSEGKFEFSLPIDNLKGTIFEKGKYSVVAEVTSGAGDTQKSSPLFFYLGSGYEARPTIPAKVKVSGDTLNFNIPVYDIAGLPVKKDVEYKITGISPEENDSEVPDSISLSGVFQSPLLSISADLLPSGRYRLEFTTEDTDNPVATETIVWRNDDTTTPYPTPLWVPETEYIYGENQNNIDITFGGYPTEWLLYILSDGKNILKTEWLQPNDSLWYLPVELPKDNSTLFVSLNGMHNFDSEGAQIKIVSKKSLEKLEIETVSFRDKITAGEKEEWTFKFNIGEKEASGINAFAVMTDKALNAIYDFKWGFNIWKPAIYNAVNINSQRTGLSSSYKSYSAYTPKLTKSPGNPVPDWESYGYPFYSYPIVRTGSVLNRSMALKQSARSVGMADYAAEGAVEETKMEMTMQDVAYDDAAAESGGNINDSEELRPVEMPVAFFKPNLRADDDGDLSVKFTVPDYNTTWQFQLAAYDENLLTSSLVLDAMATKPVMVRSNLPQFLRTGDKAEIAATLFNNSETDAYISGRLEIINPLNGKTIVSREFPPETVSPSGNRVVSIFFDVPTDISSLVVRTYGNGGKHTDGEQGLIPVLPSSTPVTEAFTFYSKSNQSNIEVKIPKIDKNAQVTLKYCDNPLWEVLLSLPSITETCNASSLSVANALYATILASDIINSNKDIYEGLSNILSEEDQTGVISNLEKDESLKIKELQATPWLNNAASETARIRSLAKYYDTEEVKTEIESKIKTLQNLQKPDGGWTWFEGMKSSPFITRDIINVLGYLNANGLLTAELKKMAEKGVKYMDKHLLETYEKNKRLNIPSSLDYFYARDMLKLPESAGLKRIKTETLDSIVSQWRHLGIGMKAKGAILLLNNMNLKNGSEYGKEGETIAASLSQFTDTRMSLQEETLMLQLFAKTGDTEAKDRVMQSMLLQKETRAWGVQSNSIALIYSLVTLSPNVNIKRKSPKIYVGSQSIKLPENQILSGNFTIDLKPADISGKTIVITRETGVPAWGGIVTQYVSPIQDVKSARVENLSIEKRIFKKGVNGEVREVDSYQKGDKVSVVLDLTVGKDMDYVVITDSRSACLQPTDKTSGYTFKDGLWAYREIGAASSSFFIENLPAGKYVISYECHADREGEYSSGMAEVQCLYSPIEVAHSGGSEIRVE